MNYKEKVGDVLRNLFASNSMFTCYDITRILQSKSGRYHVNHDNVRIEIERRYFSGEFPFNWTRHVANHLNFQPLNPQVYHSSHSDWRQYNPESLNPFMNMCTMQPKSNVEPKKTVKVVAVPASDIYTDKVYALKVKDKDVWVTSRSRNRSGRTTHLYEASYSTKNGPVQLLRQVKTPMAYEVVCYNILFNPVENV